MANHTTANRRPFLMSLFSLCSIPGAIAAMKFRIGESVARPIPSKFPVEPKFWVGDAVGYPWYCIEENTTHWDKGEAMGICWSPVEEKWLYVINSTESTFVPFRPIFDEQQVTDEEGLEHLAPHLSATR